MGWITFFATYAAFLASHMIPARPEVRGRLIATVGQRAYVLGYSLLSLGLLYLLIIAAGQAPRVTLWEQTRVARWAVNIAMPLSISLIVLSVGCPNPLSFGGRQHGFDPARPGIVGVTRHPLLWALVLWSGAHLLANGELAHVFLFGGMLVFAFGGMLALDRRSRTRLAEDFDRMCYRAPLLPFGRGWPTGWTGSFRRLALAGLIWAAVYNLHPALFAASPRP